MPPVPAAAGRAGQREHGRRLLDEVAQPAQHFDGFPASWIEQRIGQPLIADHIQLPMVAGALQQRLDLGEAGVEVLTIERGAALGDDALELQILDHLVYPLQRHAVHSVF